MGRHLERPSSAETGAPPVRSGEGDASTAELSDQVRIGRVDDALDQAKNLVSLPRHPKYNSIEKRGSYKYGRMRLLQTMTEYELWEQLVDEAGGPYFPPTKKAEEQEEWLGWLAVAHFRTGNPARGAKSMRSLQRRRIKLQSALLDLADEQPDEQPRDATQHASASGTCTRGLTWRF